MKTIFIILLLITTIGAYAQVEVGDVLSDKHQLKLEKIENPRKKLKKYRKYYSNDSTKYMKLQEKLAVLRIDSTREAYKKARQLAAEQQVLSPEANNVLTQAEQTSGKLKQSAPSLQNTTTSASGTLALQNKDNPGQVAKTKAKQQLLQEATTHEETTEYVAMYTENQELVQDARNLSDSTTVTKYKEKGKEETKTLASQAEQKAAQKAGVDQLDKQAGEYNELKNTPAGYQKQMKGYQEQLQLNQLAKKASRENAAQFFMKNADKLLQTQQKMDLLKNKYTSVLNSGDMSSAVKINSMEERSFRERLVLGGDFQLVSTKPLILSASPTVGYKFSKRLSAGVGGNFRIGQTQKGASHSNAIHKQKEAMGYKTFVQYVVLKNFHVIAEFENMYTPVPSLTADETTKMWVPGAFVGVGKKFSVHAKINGTISVLYNIIYDNLNSPYSSPLVFRFGYQLSQLALLKKK